MKSATSSMEWVVDVLVIATIASACLLYALGLYRSSRRDPLRRRLRSWHVACFALGQLTLITALLSPLDSLSDLLFSAHMTQHELLMIVAAPLLVVGRPLATVARGLPARLRPHIMTTVSASWFRRSWAFVTNPLVVVLAHAVVLWAWHLPLLFEAALRSEPLHAFQHLTFFVTAALFWWAIIHGRYGRIGYGASVLFVFITAMHTGLLGALITSAKTIWYPLHAMRSESAAVDAHADQQLAGVLMWIPAGVILTIVALALFAAWLGEAERRTERANRST